MDENQISSPLLNWMGAQSLYRNLSVGKLQGISDIYITYWLKEKLRCRITNCAVFHSSPLPMTQCHVPREWNYQVHRCEHLKIRIMLFYSHLFSEKSILFEFLAMVYEHVFDLSLYLSSLTKLG
jgi:hypothetical protein